VVEVKYDLGHNLVQEFTPPSIRGFFPDPQLEFLQDFTAGGESFYDLFKPLDEVF
jgi:hypothetical protein